MKDILQDRTEFGEQITGVRLPALQIATPGCDWNLVARLSREIPTTIVLGGGEAPWCSRETFETIEGQSWWLPDGHCRAPDMEHSGEWPHCVSLQRRDVDLGSVQLSGASLRLPTTNANLIESESLNRKVLIRLFREDAMWLADIVNRRCDEESISVVVTAGGTDRISYSQATRDIRGILREMGVQLQHVSQCSLLEARCRAFMRRVRRAFSRYATIHIDPEGVYLPQQALVPYVINGRRTLGARMPLVDSRAPGIRCISIADLLYTTSTRFPGQQGDYTPHLRYHVFAWCHVVAFLVRRLAGSGLSAAIEGFPLDALSSERHIVVSVFVEGISEEVERAMEREFSEAIGRTPYAVHVQVNVLGVKSVDQAKATVRTLGVQAIECIHGALMDDADAFRPYGSATVERRELIDDGVMADRRTNNAQREEDAYAGGLARYEDVVQHQIPLIGDPRMSAPQDAEKEDVATLDASECEGIAV
jgi:hypothetical protein